MKHRSYSFNSVQVVQLMRKSGAIDLPKKSRTTSGLAIALGKLYKMEPKMLQTMECVIHCEEYNWMSSGQLVYFLESADMARNIMRGSFNIKDTEPLYKGAESFVLMLPDDLLIDGRKGSGCLVTIQDHALRGENIFNSFFDAAGLPRTEVRTSGEHGKFTVCIDYQEKSGSNMYTRAAIPNHYIEKVMAMDTLEQYRAFMEETNCFNYFMGSDLDLSEQQYQFELLRLVCGFLVYKHALPDRVRPGLPSNTRGEEASSPFFKRPQAFTVCHPHAEHKEVAGHYRSWHFRQLMAERFYQGEHANKKPGERIVFVSDSFVNRGDAEIYTAEEVA